MTPEQITEMTNKIAALRREIAGLATQADIVYTDAVCTPPPTRRTGSHPNFPGPEWKISTLRNSWSVHTDPNEADAVFIHSPNDLADDVAALRTDDARRFALAILAACNWADRTRPVPADIPVLANARQRRRKPS